MPPRRVRLFAVAGILYLVVAIWPFQPETRLVGLASAAVFAALAAADRRRRPGATTGPGTDAGERRSVTVAASRRDGWLMSVGVMLLAGFAVAGLVLLARPDPPPPGGAAFDRAAAAAVVVTRGGQATEVERTTDDDARWEVDVITADGAAVDVRLDRQYRLVTIADETDEAARGPRS